jgi:hypothetical protein
MCRQGGNRKAAWTTPLTGVRATRPPRTLAGSGPSQQYRSVISLDVAAMGDPGARWSFAHTPISGPSKAAEPGHWQRVCEEARARLRGEGLRGDRGGTRPAARGGWHRPSACGKHHCRLGRTEGGAGNHGFPAQPVRRWAVVCRSKRSGSRRARSAVSWRLVDSESLLISRGMESSSDVGSLAEERLQRPLRAFGRSGAMHPRCSSVQ